MDYISTREAAEKWGVSLRHVQRLLKNSRIPGARKYGVSWLIPAKSEKPALLPREPEGADGGKASQAVCAAYPVLHIRGGNVTGAFKRCQSEEERALLAAYIDFYRGDALSAGAAAAAILAGTKEPLVQLGCGVLRASAALYAGDPAAWRAAVVGIAETHVPPALKITREFAVSAANVLLHGRDVYPKWLESGALTGLSADLLPAAYWMYAEILYIKCKELDLAAVAEPLIAACHKEQSDVPELYLRLLAAVAYHNRGDRARAKAHIAAAVALAKPLGFLSPFVEYRHMIAVPMDTCFDEAWPEALPEIKRRMQPFMENWARVYTAVWEQPFTDALTQREYEVALLASRGLSIGNIAERTGLSHNSVKKYVSAAYTKLGVKKKSELRRFFHHP